MSSQAAFRGQPLLLIGLLLIGWCVVRAASWHPPDGRFGDGLLESAKSVAVASPRASGASAGPANALEAGATGASGGNRAAVDPQRYTATPAMHDISASGRTDRAPAREGGAAPGEGPPPPSRDDGESLLLAGLLKPRTRTAEPSPPGQGPMSPAGGSLVLSLPPVREEKSGARWFADGWVLLRGEATSPILSGRPSYGRSQAGAILRYRLSPSSRHRPQAFLRGAVALRGIAESDLALGLSARPLPGVPVRAVAEMRASERPSGTELRPAAYLVSELPAIEWQSGARLETYFAAGRVEGDFATNFVEGQMRAEQKLARIGGAAELSAGAGAWGGAQKGTGRLDIGPTASVSFRIGPARSRLAVDYRIRIAGNAQPASGPALTLSAGF